MKKHMRRIAMILAVTVLFTVLPVGVFASEDIEPVAIDVPNLGTIEIVAGDVQINAEKKIIEMVYDEDDFLEKVKNEAGDEFFFKYDENGILKTIIDNKGNLTELKYDAGGELTDAVYKDYIAVKDEDGKVEIYTEGQDGEFVFVLAAPIVIPAAIEIAAGIIATAAAAYATYKVAKKAKRKIAYLKEYKRSKSKSKKKKKKGKSEDKEKKERNTQRIGRRYKHKTRKEAKEAAQRAGKGKKPIHHPDGKHGPHFHPDVPMPKKQTPKIPTPHDHHYY